MQTHMEDRAAPWLLMATTTDRGTWWAAAQILPSKLTLFPDGPVVSAEMFSAQWPAGAKIAISIVLNYGQSSAVAWFQDLRQSKT
jgi:hypothetical protein